MNPCPKDVCWFSPAAVQIRPCLYAGMQIHLSKTGFIVRETVIQRAILAEMVEFSNKMKYIDIWKFYDIM